MHAKRTCHITISKNNQENSVHEISAVTSGRQWRHFIAFQPASHKTEVKDWLLCSLCYITVHVLRRDHAIFNIYTCFLMNIFIDWLFSVLRRIGNISAILLKSDQFWNLEVSLATLASRSERQLHSSNKARGTMSYDCKQYMWRIIYQVHVVGVNALWFFYN